MYTSKLTAEYDVYDDFSAHYKFYYCIVLYCKLRDNDFEQCLEYNYSNKRHEQSNGVTFKGRSSPHSD